MKEINFNDVVFLDLTREVIEVKGEECLSFLQNLITQDILLNVENLKYSALLSPQGKFLFDFFIFKRNQNLYLDINKNYSQNLIEKINFYKLRANIDIRKITCNVLLTAKELTNFFDDPRHNELHRRGYSFLDKDSNNLAFDHKKNKKLRVEYCIPEIESELIFNETYILEAGFERLKGVDFKKGCYVGQEVTARMKHKANLRKGFVIINIFDDSFIEGNDIYFEKKVVGKVTTQYKDKAIAYLNLNFSDKILLSGKSKVKFFKNLNNASNNA